MNSHAILKLPLCVFLGSILFLFSCNSQKSQVEIPVLDHSYHLELNSKYADPEESPLTKQDLDGFRSLKFFPYDESFRIKASFTLTPDAKPFEMKTSTDRLPIYRKYAELEFLIDGRLESLEAYRNQKYLDHPIYGNELFIPYLDETNGVETYGGGRYLDITIPELGADSVWIDFNNSYNPYCAYNYKYSCPKPPEANDLNVRIEAGVKSGIYRN